MWDIFMHESVKARHGTQRDATVTGLKIQLSLWCKQNEQHNNNK